MNDNNKSDKKIRSLLDKISEPVNKEMADRKENVWASLEINQAIHNENPKKPKRNLGWLWFLLGMLLAVGGMFFQKQLESKPTPNPLLVEAEADDVSKNLAAQLESFKKELADIKSVMHRKSTLVDSLRKSNQTLQLVLDDNIINQQATAMTSIKYIRDTIVQTEIKEQQVIVEKLVEKVIRDTVFIDNIPLEALPMVELDPVPEETMTASNEPVINPKCSRRSVQFNFK